MSSTINFVEFQCFSIIFQLQPQTLMVQASGNQNSQNSPDQQQQMIRLVQPQQIQGLQGVQMQGFQMAGIQGAIAAQGQQQIITLPGKIVDNAMKTLRMLNLGKKALLLLKVNLKMLSLIFLS